MKSISQDQVIGIPVVSSATYTKEEFLGQYSSVAHEHAGPFLEPISNKSSSYKQVKKDSVVHWMNKFGEKAENIRHHVTMGPKISETMKGKLNLGAKIVKAGGVERVFRQAFAVGQGEILVKAMQCYLSTSAGPISGMLFISSEKIAFCSNQTLKLASSKGIIARVPYKVLIPLGRVKAVRPSENVSKPSQKYIQIVTEDDFEFWFMGFLSYEKAFKCLQKAISENCSTIKEFQIRGDMDIDI